MDDELAEEAVAVDDELAEEAEADVEVEDPGPDETMLAVVLAAGAGSRFAGDDHKLTAPLRGRPVLAWAVKHALDAGFVEVLVVEGAIEVAGVVDQRASIVRNHDWADGQARSLQVAARYASMAGYESMVIGLGDQPFVPAEAWRRVAASESAIATASFEGRTAPPVRLHGDVWGLLPLDGDEGARQLLRSRPELVTAVDCPGSALDIDTVAALQQAGRDPALRRILEQPADA